MSTCPNTPSWQTIICPTFMSCEGHVVSQVSRQHEGSLLGDISAGTLRMRASSISEITYTYLQRSCLPPLMAACQRLADHCPKVQKVSNMQDSQEGSQTETLTEGVLCPLELTRKLRLGAGSATEFQFRGSFGCRHGQPPQ